MPWCAPEVAILEARSLGFPLLTEPGSKSACGFDQFNVELMEAETCAGQALLMVTPGAKV